MGFTDDNFLTANTTATRESETTALLDRTTSVLVQTSLCSGSIVTGKGGQSALAMIHLAAFAPSSVIAFSPNNMLEVPAPNIAGASITNATFALALANNQNNEDLSTLNEQWTVATRRRNRLVVQFRVEISDTIAYRIVLFVLYRDMLCAIGNDVARTRRFIGGDVSRKSAILRWLRHKKPPPFQTRQDTRRNSIHKRSLSCPILYI
jgi:hypothetical protein